MKKTLAHTTSRSDGSRVRPLGGGSPSICSPTWRSATATSALSRATGCARAVCVALIPRHRDRRPVVVVASRRYRRAGHRDTYRYGEGRPGPSPRTSVRLLAFSDLHCDLAGAERLVGGERGRRRRDRCGRLRLGPQRARAHHRRAAGDRAPTLLVPGNNETEDACAACEGWGGDGAPRRGRRARRVEFWGPRRGRPDHPLGLELRPRRARGRRLCCRPQEGLRPRRHSPLLRARHQPPGPAAVTSTKGRSRSAIEAKRPASRLRLHPRELGQESRSAPPGSSTLGPRGASWVGGLLTPAATGCASRGKSGLRAGAADFHRAPVAWERFAQRS